MMSSRLEQPRRSGRRRQARAVVQPEEKPAPPEDEDDEAMEKEDEGGLFESSGSDFENELKKEKRRSKLCRRRRSRQTTDDDDDDEKDDGGEQGFTSDDDDSLSLAAEAKRRRLSQSRKKRGAAVAPRVPKELPVPKAKAGTKKKPMLGKLKRDLASSSSSSSQAAQPLPCPSASAANMLVGNSALSLSSSSEGEEEEAPEVPDAASSPAAIAPHTPKDVSKKKSKLDSSTTISSKLAALAHSPQETHQPWSKTVTPRANKSEKKSDSSSEDISSQFAALVSQTQESAQPWCKVEVKTEEEEEDEASNSTRKKKGKRKAEPKAKTSRKKKDEAKAFTASPDLKVSDLLALGETNGDQLLQNGASLSDVDDEGPKAAKSSSPPAKPEEQKNIEVTIALPEHARRKKKGDKKEFDVEAHLKRALSKARRDMQVQMHQAHILCLLAHQRYLNRALRADMLLGVALSVVPADQVAAAAGKGRNLNRLSQLLAWFCKKFSPAPSDDGPADAFPAPLGPYLLRRMGAFSFFSNEEKVLVFLLVCRALGYRCRLVLNLAVMSLKPPKEEMDLINKAGPSQLVQQIEGKNKVAVKKETEDVESGKEGAPSSKKAVKVKEEKEECASKSKNKSTGKNSKQETEAASSKSRKRGLDSTKEEEGANETKEDRKDKSKRNKKESVSKDSSKEAGRQTSRRGSRKVATTVDSENEDSNDEDSKKKSATKRGRSSCNIATSSSSSRSKKEKKEGSSKDEEPKSNKNKKSKEEEPALSKRARKEAEERRSSRRRSDRQSTTTKKAALAGRDEDEDSDEEEDFVPTPKRKSLAPKKKEPTKSIAKGSVSSKTAAKSSSKSGGKKKTVPTDYWLEVYLNKEWTCVDVVLGKIGCHTEMEERASKPMLYVLACNEDGSLKDVTRRYAKQFMTQTRRSRCDEKWMERTLAPFETGDRLMDLEEERALDALMAAEPMPTSVGAFKNHPLYVLPRHLLKFEGIYPANAPTLGFLKGEPVYARECVRTLHCRVTWLKEGRTVKLHEEPYKVVKARPKYDRMTGNVTKDEPLDLFGHWQTELYDPPPVVDGRLPRNEYGNIDLFKPWMLPKGAAHLQVGGGGVLKLARKLNIDCAEAMIGWDFHGGMCHPVFDGVVLPEESKDVLLDAWTQEQVEKAKKDADKKEKRVLANWKKLVRGLLIHQKIKNKYTDKN